MNYGKQEHEWEARTTLLLLITTLTSITYWLTRWYWLIALITILLLATLLAHLIARTNHLLEKREYKKRR